MRLRLPSFLLVLSLVLADDALALAPQPSWQENRATCLQTHLRQHHLLPPSSSNCPTWSLEVSRQAAHPWFDLPSAQSQSRCFAQYFRLGSSPSPPDHLVPSLRLRQWPRTLVLLLLQNPLGLAQKTQEEIIARWIQPSLPVLGEESANPRFGYFPGFLCLRDRWIYRLEPLLVSLISSEEIALVIFLMPAEKLGRCCPNCLPTLYLRSRCRSHCSGLSLPTCFSEYGSSSGRQI